MPWYPSGVSVKPQNWATLITSETLPWYVDIGTVLPSMSIADRP